MGGACTDTAGTGGPLQALLSSDLLRPFKDRRANVLLAFHGPALFLLQSTAKSMVLVNFTETLQFLAGVFTQCQANST